MAAKRESILVDDLTHCMICGRCPELHEVFFGQNRSLSIRYKMVVPLCAEHHRGDTGAHKDISFDRYLKKLAQEKWEATYGDREAFRKIFGKSYL